VGGLTINPGDLLHGDRDGVATVPSTVAPLVATAAAQFAAIEDSLLRRIRRAAGNPEELKAARNEAAERTGNLSKRVIEMLQQLERS
jgi:regulator of RNase E activity RraA